MWLSDVCLILPDRVIPRGAVVIDNGMVAEIRERPVAGAPEAGGVQVFPGFIDMHGDMIETELEPRPGVDFPVHVALRHLDARLAAAGVTTAYAAVSFSKGVRAGERRSFAHTSETIRALHALRAELRVAHKIHARFDVTFDGAVGVLADLVAAGTVDLVSLMDHTPGQGQYRDLERHVEQVATQHSVSAREARDMVATRIAERTRPQSVLLETLREVAQLCRTHAVALASHDDATAEKAGLMADLGATISEFPVTLDAAQAADARGMMIAMGAPNAMRGSSYSGNLSARAAHARGLLHILAADYHPATILPAVQLLAEQDPGGLPGAAALAASNPAAALGLHDRGRIAPGLRADLALVAPGGRGHVVATLSGGEVIYSDGRLSGLTPPRGAVA